MSVSLTKPSDGPAHVAEPELDQRRITTNPSLETLTAHQQGLAMNDPYTLRSAFATLASIHPDSHAWNRQTRGIDALYAAQREMDLATDGDTHSF